MTASLKRVAILAPEPIRPRMAGMGIRALELARALSREFEVRLLVPNEAAQAREVAGTLEVVAVQEGALAEAARGADAAVVSGHAANWWFHQVPDVPVAADLYDPFPVENLHYARALGEETAAHDRRSLALALARADFFLCASAEQRLFYAGALFDAGRIGPRNFPGDPALTRLLAVVPFGTPSEAARGDRAAGRRAVGAPGEGPLVLFGGVYDWYDPELLLQAWPEILRGAPAGAPALLREPEPRDDAAARLRARAGARPRDRSGGALGRLLAVAAVPGARGPLRGGGPARVHLFRGAGDRARLPHAPARRRLGRRAVRFGRRGHARARAVAVRRRVRVRAGRGAARPGASRTCSPTRRGAQAAGAAARAFAAARSWQAVTAPLSEWCRDARVDPGRLPVPAGDGIGERLKNLFR